MRNMGAAGSPHIDAISIALLWGLGLFKQSGHYWKQMEGNMMPDHHIYATQDHRTTAILWRDTFKFPQCWNTFPAQWWNVSLTTSFYEQWKMGDGLKRQCECLKNIICAIPLGATRSLIYTLLGMCRCIPNYPFSISIGYDSQQGKTLSTMLQCFQLFCTIWS